MMPTTNPLAGVPAALPGGADEGPYRWLFEHSLDGVLLTRLDGSILAANPAMCRMLGYTADEILTLGRAGIVDASDPRLAPALELRRRTGRFVGELTFVAKDGRRVPVELSSQVVRDADGTELTSMFVRDISERRRAEEALRLNEERYRVALRNSPITVATVDADLRVTWLSNPPAPIDAEAAVGKLITEILPAGDGTEVVRLVEDVLATGRSPRREVRIRIAGVAHTFDVTAEPLRDAEGRIVGATAAATDVTLRKRAEERERFLSTAGELLAKSLDFESTIDRIAHLAIPILGDSCILDVSLGGGDALLAVAHVDPAMEPTIRSLRERFPVPADSPHPLAVVRRTGQPMLLPEITGEFLDAISMGPEQRRIVAQVGAKSSVVVPLIATGRVLGVLTCFSTSRVLDEEDLSLAMELARRAAMAVDNARAYAAARNATHVRDEVLGIVSHDLRNAVAAISMSADLLDAAADRDQVSRLAEQITRATLWMRHLITDLVDVTALEAGRLYVKLDLTAASGIAEAVRALHEPRARRRGIDLAFEVATLPPFRADADRVVQAVGNILGNAIKFTPRGGQVTFAIEPHPEGIGFRVTDSGPGIAPEDVPHLFDRFWQAQKTRRGGAGLGLAIAKGIAEAHGGRIEVVTAPGAGSTFTLVLPTAPGHRVTDPR